MTHSGKTGHTYEKPLRDAVGGGPRCACEGCDAPGEFRAPKDRSLSDYYLFCLEHVRAYNAGWDFHADLTPEEIEEGAKAAFAKMSEK